MFTFDPNDIDAMVAYWKDEVGDEFRGRKYNGFIFCNEDGEVLDLFVADADGEWVGPDPKPEPGDETWERIFEQMPEGTTNVLAMHAHLEEEPIGPCAGLHFFADVFEASAKAHGATARGVIVLHADDLDGMLFMGTADNGTRADLAAVVLDIIAGNPLIPDSTREALEEIIAANEEGRTSDPALLMKAIDDLQDTMDALGMELDEEDEAPRIEPVHLPLIDPTQLPALPPFDPFDPTTWRN